jgi:2-C-methyl-D-erythritol 4-phosphate cytidylyltransferase/2-C-methyl-D-erythritol 2,4-cyclodiphosphate synthase
MIISAYAKAYREGFYGTDDASLVERAGEAIHIIDGLYENIKITTREDMPANIEMRVGTGFDAHALAAGRKLVLGGIEIPFDKGLLGHSDADVLIHAVIDALLGAAGCRDIGAHFPDSDEKTKNISSLLLLKEIAKVIKTKDYEIGNIDATVIAEKPKIAPYVEKMIKAMAEALDIPEDRINIKGTTTEKLGFPGREEGIAAQAVCTLYPG